MIDDPNVVSQLMKEMKTHLPIPAQVTPELRQMIRKQKVLIPASRQVQIDQVFYSGDEGGIVCGLAFPGAGDQAFVVSLTHLRIANAHPLATAIRDYQRARVKKLS
ncbi:MAG: hypothetical protein HOP18_18175 [Deltaproteobacteria bacterium]|nr:hypothetical protein [Deltaproteobacteria bacterium]